MQRVVHVLLGAERESSFDAILAGDIVRKKKPAPDIYNLALRQLNVSAGDCLVVEDSRNGLLAARAAGIRCLITTNAYTIDEDFSEAARVVPELGDPPAESVNLDDLVRLAKGNDQSPTVSEIKNSEAFNGQVGAGRY